jgi:hypothetical protein
MAKVSKAPPAFYSASQAIRRLGINRGTFFDHVKKGKIQKIIPPGASEGYYRKEEIDAMAQAKELFLLQYSIAPRKFERANTEEDIRGIYDLCVAAYGISNTPSLEERLDEWKQLPEAYYVVKQESIVVGYISLFWFTDEALADLMTPRQHQTSLTVDVMRPFIPGQPIDHLFVSLAVRPGLTNEQQRKHGFKLLRDTIQVLESLAQRGMPVRKLYATSRTTDGIKLARDMDMKETKYPNDPTLRFELDLEYAKTPLAREYQRVVKACKAASKAETANTQNPCSQTSS